MAVPVSILTQLRPLVEVCTPPPAETRVYGYHRGTEGTWELSAYGAQLAAIAQRILLRYVLQMDTRGELAIRYSLSERMVQAIISGESYHHLTLPLRKRLLDLGIGNPRMIREAHERRHGDRARQIKASMERLMRDAADALSRADWTGSRADLSLNLWLLSGQWLADEDEPCSTTTTSPGVAASPAARLARSGISTSRRSDAGAPNAVLSERSCETGVGRATTRVASILSARPQIADTRRSGVAQSAPTTGAPTAANGPVARNAADGGRRSICEGA